MTEENTKTEDSASDHGPSYCPECHEYMRRSGHTCDPEWQCEVAGEGWGTARGDGPSAAAEKAADWYWEDNLPDDGDTLVVAVRDAGSVVSYEVTACWSLDASARRVDTGEQGES